MVDRRDEIPKEFSLREQLEEVTAIYTTRRDFLEGKTRKRNMGTEEQNIQAYHLAVLAAVGRTIRGLMEEETAALERRKAAAAGDDGF